MDLGVIVFSDLLILDVLVNDIDLDISDMLMIIDVLILSGFGIVIIVFNELLFDLDG